MMRTPDDILGYIRGSRERFAEMYGVRRIGIFASVARGEALEGSDLVLADAVKQRLRPIIEQEVVYA